VDFTDSLSFTFRYIHDDRNDPTPLLFQPYMLNGRPLAASAYRAGAVVPTKPNQISADEEISLHGHTDNYQLAGRLDLDFATLSSYTMYRRDKAIQHYSLDYGNAKITALIYPDSNRTVSQEFILASKAGGKLQYTVGAFYYDNNEIYPSVQVSAGGAPFFQSAASGVNSVSIAGFADATYEAMDNLFLTAGVRYTHDQQKDAFFVSSQPAGAKRTDVPTLNNSKVTPRAVVRYELGSDSSVYASYAQGFKSAILNVGGGTLTGIAIRPEKIDAFEVGYKYAAHALTFNVSGYYYNYKDQQVTANHDVNGVPQSVLTNAAVSHIYGIDGDLGYQITDRFRFNLGASWNHARFSSFPNAPFYKESAAVPGTFSVITVDASGNHMSRSPDFSGTAAATYTLDVANGLLDLSANIAYSSKFYFDTVQQFSQKGYATVGLRAQWTDPSSRFTIGVAGNNVTNNHYLIVASPNSAGIASSYGAPATAEGFIWVNLN
jgi:iron complex outermembrane receptor protein